MIEMKVAIGIRAVKTIEEERKEVLLAGNESYGRGEELIPGKVG